MGTEQIVGYAVIAVFGGIVLFFVKKIIADFTKDLKVELTALSDKLDTVEKEVNDFRVEFIGNYLKTPRYEAHEKENRESFARAHSRIDLLEKDVSNLKGKLGA
jgi:hypothetical protein